MRLLDAVVIRLAENTSSNISVHLARYFLFICVCFLRRPYVLFRIHIEYCLELSERV